MEKEYIVNVTRISYGFRDIIVKANSKEEATAIALDSAGNHTFSEREADYEVGGVKEVSYGKK